MTFKHFVSLTALLLFALSISAGFVFWQKKTSPYPVQPTTQMVPLPRILEIMALPQQQNGTAEGGNNVWNTYRDGREHFELRYPAAWTLESEFEPVPRSFLVRFRVEKESTLEIVSGPAALRGIHIPLAYYRERESIFNGKKWIISLRWGADRETAELWYEKLSEEQFQAYVREYQDDYLVIAQTKHNSVPYNVEFFFEGNPMQNLTIFDQIISKFQFLK